MKNMTNEIDGKKIRQMILSLRNCTKEERSDTMEYLRDLLYHGDLKITGLPKNNYDETTSIFATKSCIDSAKKNIRQYLSKSSDDDKSYGLWTRSRFGSKIIDAITVANELSHFESCLLYLVISELDISAFDLNFMHKLITPKYIEKVKNIKRYELLINEAIRKGYYYVPGYHDYIDIDMIMSLIHEKNITCESVKLVYPNFEILESEASTKKESNNNHTDEEEHFMNGRWSENEMRKFLIESRKIRKPDHMKMYGIVSYHVYNTRLNKIKCYFGMPYVDWDGFWGEPIRGRGVKKNSV